MPIAPRYNNAIGFLCYKALDPQFLLKPRPHEGLPAFGPVLGMRKPCLKLGLILLGRSEFAFLPLRELNFQPQCDLVF